MASRSFIKWAGGKARLLSEITRRLPPTFNRYFEPFVGGGSLFWHLLPEEAYLSDMNRELVNAYMAVKYNPEFLMADLRKHIHSREYFFALRNTDRFPDFAAMGAIARASRFIYLNKAGFNGWWAENADGQATLGYGYRTNPVVFTADNILQCSRALQWARIHEGPFAMLRHFVQPGDFVYLDPPYLPPGGSTMRQYTAGGCDIRLHEELAELCRWLDTQQVLWMLSNSAHDDIKRLFYGYSIETVHIPRLLAGKASARRVEEELLITNYAPGAVLPPDGNPPAPRRGGERRGVHAAASAHGKGTAARTV